MEDPAIDLNTSISHLPDDCLTFIFQRFDCISDRDSFGLTCRRWLNIQNVNRRYLQFQCSFTVLNRYSLSQTSLDVNSYHLHRLLARFQHLEHLSLSGCTELPDSSLTCLHHYGSRLHSLYLDCCFGITDDGLSIIANACPSLRIISLYRCNISDIGLETLAEASIPLTNVNLSYCPFVTDCGLKTLIRACSQLQSIKISNCSKITGVGFTGCSPTLANVDAESCQLEPDGIEGAVSGGGIEFLNISGANWHIGKDWMVPIGSGLASRLKILNLRMCRTVGDESIVAIAKGCPLLQEWNLALCHEVRVSGWEAIGKFCHSLQKLHVNRCRNLCDQGLRAIRNGCKKLCVLYMNGNGRVSVAAFEMFRLYRADVEIRKEELMIIGPDWTCFR